MSKISEDDFYKIQHDDVINQRLDEFGIDSKEFYKRLAYDVDKVVDKLEKSIVLKVSQYPLHGDYLKKTAVIAIAKGGGIDD